MKPERVYLPPQMGIVVWSLSGWRKCIVEIGKPPQSSMQLNNKAREKKRDGMK